MICAELSWLAGFHRGRGAPARAGRARAAVRGGRLGSGSDVLGLDKAMPFAFRSLPVADKVSPLLDDVLAGPRLRTGLRAAYRAWTA